LSSKSHRSKELAELLVEKLDIKMRFFDRVISPEYFGCEFLHDKELYQRDIKDKLTAYLDHILYEVYDTWI